MAKKKIDSVRIIQGAAGSGKTTLLRQLLARALSDLWWGLVQDPDKQFADLVPWYPSVDAWNKALAAASSSGEPFCRGAAIGCMEEEEFTAGALELAGGCERPVLIAYDEAVLMEGSTAHYVSPIFRNMLGRRRHLGVAPVLLCQDFGLTHKLWQNLCTEAYVSRCRDEERVRIIAKRFGVPWKPLYERLRTLPDYQFLRLQQG